MERTCPLAPPVTATATAVAAEEEEEEEEGEEVGKRWAVLLPKLLVDGRLGWKRGGLEGRLVARRREKEPPMPMPMPSPPAEVEDGKGAFSKASALN